MQLWMGARARVGANSVCMLIAGSLKYMLPIFIRKGTTTPLCLSLFVVLTVVDANFSKRLLHVHVSVVLQAL